jgi:hypothetical protein
VLAAALIASAQFEREGLRRAVSELIQIAEVIQLDAAVLHSGAGQDAIVLASVLGHLQVNAPVESCFLNRNSKDFDDPDILERLEALDCKFFPKFTPALSYISARLA